MKTRAKYEQHLNELLNDTLSFEYALERFIYLTSKRRTPRTTKSHLQNCIINGKLGTLIRRLDPTLFNTGYNDFTRWGASEQYLYANL